MRKSIFAGKRIEGVLVVCLLFVFLTGCGKEVQLQSGTNLQLQKDGGVTVTYIEEFPADYYDVSELDAMNREEVEEYNSQVGEEAITVLSTTSDGNKLTLSMQYKDADTYGIVNTATVFNGNIGQAKALGYDFNRTFVNTKDGAQVRDIIWEDMENHHVFITDELSTIYTYGKIEYVTENVTVSDDKKMAMVTGEGQAVIVFK